MPQQSSIVNRESSIRAWLLLALTLALCAPPLFVSLGNRLSTHTMENVALVTSQETWIRWHDGESGAWMVTSNDGLPRVEKPPLLTWLDFVAWSDLSPQTATPAQLTYRARLVTVALGLILLASIFWLGCSLGDVRTAVVATLAAGSMFFFQRQARTASYDIHFVTWATLAVAAAMWAMKPSCFAKESDGGTPSRARQIAGWSIAGIAMALSVLSKNPLSYAIVLIPVVSAIVLNPTRLNRKIIGLGAAIVISLLPVLPWYLHVTQAYPDSAGTMFKEWKQPRVESQFVPVYYYFNVFGLVLPWTVWLIAGLAHAWRVSDRQAKRLALIAFCWFVLILILFSSHPAKQQRYILPIIPAAALLCAQALRAHQAASDRSDRDRVARALGHWVWGGVLLGSMIVGLLLATGNRFIPASWNWSFEEQFPRADTRTAIVVCLLLCVIAVVGSLWNLQWKPLRSAITLGIWGLTFTTMYWIVDKGEPHRFNEVLQFKLEAVRVAKLIGDRPIRSLRVRSRDDAPFKLNEEFRFYLNRYVRRITPEELADFASQSATPVYVLARPKKAYVESLQLAGYQRIDDRVMTDEREVQELWVKGK